MPRFRFLASNFALAAWASIAAVAADPASPASVPLPTGHSDSGTAVGQAAPALTDGLPYVYTQWKHFTVQDGLPDDHIMAVKADGPRVWIGTEDGLACLDKRTGKFKTWEFKDQDNDGRADEPYSLPWRVITAIDVDPRTGDVWLGLFGGGLARLSAGRFDHYHQLNSGLVNDVVYGVAVQDENVWAATTAGASRYNTATGEWSIYTEKNAPMEEIWNYGVSYDGKGKVFLAVWGSGCLEFDVERDRQQRGDPWVLIWGVQVAGLNRAKIRDVLAYRSKPWPGVTGDIPLSGCLDDAGEVFLARRENGVWKYHSRADLQIPAGNPDLASAPDSGRTHP